MRNWLILSCWAVFVSRSFASFLDFKDSNFSLIDSEFKNDFILIEFYAPWCGHCKRLLQILEETLPHVESKMKIAKVDITENKQTAERFKVKSYPTVMYYDRGVFGDYEGPRDMENIIAFADRMTTPNPLVVTNSDTVTDTLLKHNYGFLFVSNVNYQKLDRNDEIFGKTPKDWAIAYANATYSQRAIITAGYASWSDIPSIYPQIQVPADVNHEVAIFRAETNKKPYFFDKDSVSDLKRWIKTSNHHLITPLNRNNYKYVADMSEKLLAVVVINASEPQVEVNAYMDGLTLELEELVSESPGFHDRLAVGYLDGVEWMEYLNAFGIHVNLLPQVYVFNAKTKEFYQNSSLVHVSPQGVVSFCQDVLDGKYPAQTESWFSKISKHVKSLGTIGIVGIVLPVIMIFTAFFMKTADPEVPKKSKSSKKEKAA